MFNLIDNTNLNAKGKSREQLVSRVLAKTHYTQVWQAKCRAAHVPRRRITFESNDEDEQKSNMPKKPRLQNYATAHMLHGCDTSPGIEDTYTSGIMKEVRKTSRPQWYCSEPAAKG